MELTTQQIKEVENYLNTKGISQIDVRIEVLDHMLIDIERLIEENEYDFERAFQLVSFKWNKHLVERTSFYFGVLYSAPRIVLNKAKKEFKKFYFILISSYFIPVVVLLNTNMKVSSEAISLINPTISIVIIVFILFFINTYYKKSKTKLKTTYSFILKTQKLSLLFLTFPLFGQEFINENNEFNSIYIGLIMAFICSSITTRYFYQKHVSVIYKYKNV
jgi:hypothetical protein